MQLPNNAVVLVADGRKMLFLRNTGDAEYPDLTVETASEDHNPASRDEKTDAAGRASSDTGAAHATMGNTDTHQQEEDRFAIDAADLLKTRALAHDYDHLVVIAAPRTLGELRKHYHKEVQAKLIGEIHKDLTGHPVSDIEKAIRDA